MRKKITGILALSFLLISSLNSCYYDIEAELYAQSGGPCDTTGVTYTNTVVPYLQTQCISCHSTAFASGNIALDSYSAVKTHVNNGKLFGSINHSAGYSPMPQGGNKTNSCTLEKIKAWIDNGAQNN